MRSAQGHCWLIYALISVRNESGGALREKRDLQATSVRVREKILGLIVAIKEKLEDTGLYFMWRSCDGRESSFPSTPPELSPQALSKVLQVTETRALKKKKKNIAIIASLEPDRNSGEVR